MTLLHQKPLQTFTCMNGIVELYSDRIIIRKKGWLSRFGFMFSGNTLTISLYQLKDIKFYGGIMWANGVVRLRTPNGNVLLFFAPKAYPQALVMRDMVEDLLSRQRVFPELKEKLRRT